MRSVIISNILSVYLVVRIVTVFTKCINVHLCYCIHRCLSCIHRLNHAPSLRRSHDTLFTQYYTCIKCMDPKQLPSMWNKFHRLAQLPIQSNFLTITQTISHIHSTLLNSYLYILLLFHCELSSHLHHTHILTPSTPPQHHDTIKYNNILTPLTQLILVGTTPYNYRIYDVDIIPNIIMCVNHIIIIL